MVIYCYYIFLNDYKLVYLFFYNAKLYLLFLLCVPT